MFINLLNIIRIREEKRSDDIWEVHSFMQNIILLQLIDRLHSDRQEPVRRIVKSSAAPYQKTPHSESPTQALARSAIHRIHEVNNDVRIDRRNISSLRDTLLEEAVGIFVCATPPRGICVGKIEVCTSKCRCDLSIRSKLSASVRRNATSDLLESGLISESFVNAEVRYWVQTVLSHPPAECNLVDVGESEFQLGER